MEEAQEKNKILEAKLVEICGDPEIVNNVLEAENRRRRLEFITVSSTKVGEVNLGEGEKICLFDTHQGGPAEEWRKALPLRFRRELELEEAHSEIVEVRRTEHPTPSVELCIVCICVGVGRGVFESTATYDLLFFVSLFVCLFVHACVFVFVFAPKRLRLHFDFFSF